VGFDESDRDTEKLQKAVERDAQDPVSLALGTDPLIVFQPITRSEKQSLGESVVQYKWWFIAIGGIVVVLVAVALIVHR
jgi:hypothetical protein